MLYKYSSLLNLILDKSLSKSELSSSGNLTKAYKSMCEAISQAIVETHNNWQSNANINGVLVSGGSCSPQGSLSNGIGNASPRTSISITIPNFTSLIKSYFPTNEMHSLTEATSSYVSSISLGFTYAYNDFLNNMSISNIQVNGGSCTCLLSPPTPGSYSGGTGSLQSLSGNISTTLKKNSIKTYLIEELNSNIIPNGAPTVYLLASIDAICEALEEYNDVWVQSTGISNLSVNGGVTIANGPISAAIGNRGKFV